MYYLIYKTICLINGKYYVGKHKTKDRDDDYLGSGKLLRAAIKKHGRENFVREILFECSTEDEMNLAEKILVVPDREVNYNLCPGGQGGWGYVSSNRLQVTEKQKRSASVRMKSEEGNRVRNIIKERHPLGTMFGRKHNVESKRKMSENNNGTKGKKFSSETKTRMSNSHTGSRNSMYGIKRIWIFNEECSKRVLHSEIDMWLKKGYKKGTGKKR